LESELSRSFFPPNLNLPQTISCLFRPSLVLRLTLLLLLLLLLPQVEEGMGGHLREINPILRILDEHFWGKFFCGFFFRLFRALSRCWMMH
jgi:hypothetical protein